MAKFRKKPVVVEAEQWFPGKHVVGVTEAVYGDAANGGNTRTSGYGTCVTIHGQPTRVEPGDWIITEPDGTHHYPCKPDIFAATYESVE